MSYTVLARRYRSGTFDQVIGQEHVAQTLKKAIQSGRIAHAYLFCGTRGTGKTSTARILAKALNCEKSDGPTPEPCGQCASCQAIARGEDIDVIEIDAASNTGVDNVRDIIENAGYRPARSRFKIYIIDEVHMLSKSAFNALLKTLEEPPSHVKFILATTEPEKVLPTILSRCQRYDFRNIPTRDIAAHLKDICQQEKIQAEEDALLLIAKAGAGSMRDALSLLDRLLSIGEKKLTAAMIEQLLGLPRSQVVFDLAQAIGQGDVKATLEQADAMIQGGLSVDSFLAALIEHLRNLLILNACGAESKLVEVPGLALSELVRQAQRFDAVTLTQDITILEELRRQIRQSQGGRALLDATLVRLALAEQFASIGELLNEVDATESPAPAQKKKPEPVNRATEPPMAEQSMAKPPIAESPAPSDPGGVSFDFDLGDDDDLPRPGKVWDGPSLADAPKPSTPPVSSAPVPQPSPARPADGHDLPGIWQRFLEALSPHGPSLLALVANGQLMGISDDLALVQLPASNETFVKMLERNGKKDLVRQAMTQALGRPAGVKFQVAAEDESPAAPASPEPAAAPVRPAAASPRPETPPPPPAAPTVRLTPELKQQLEADPLIRAILTELNGGIVKVE